MSPPRNRFRSMRKSSSHDHLGSPSPLRGGGVSLGVGYASARVSPTPTAQRIQRKTASDDGTPKSTNSSAFLVGSSVDEDDIFTEASSEIASKPCATDTDTQLQVLGNSPAKVDAQVIYPGTACMFVANLSQPYEDKVLEFEVTKAFSKFGDVWVKIKRDAYQMPFAFCQFTNDQDAQRAETFGKGMKILGRPCRTEMARAQSSFLVSKKSGLPTTIAEATTLLSQLGEVAKAEFVEENAQRSLGVPPSILVTYKMYDSRREPVRHFAQNADFIVVANNPKRHNVDVVPTTKWDGGDAQMQQYDRDRRSAYVGNLPSGMTENGLRAIVSSCGEVIGIQLYRKEVPGKPGQTNCFAFVEFARPDGADELITSMTDTDIDGKIVRVERKRSRTFETPRRENGHRSCWSTLPRRRIASSFTGAQTFVANEDAPVMKFTESHQQSTSYNKSFSFGQNRRPRQTIFNTETSVGQAMASFNPDSPPEKATYAQGQGLQPKQSQYKNGGCASPSKKSVEFQLPNGTRSGTRPLTPTGTAVKRGQHVAHPSISDNGSGAATAVNTPQAAGQPTTPGMMMPPSFGWTPFYQPFQAYPYMASPFTPQQQGNEAMLQPYMGPQYPTHPAMFYNNMMMPTPPMMAHPPLPTGHQAGPRQNGESAQRSNGRRTSQ